MHFALSLMISTFGWAVEVPSSHDFATEEDGRGDLHLDPAAVADMEIQWESDLDVCDPVGTSSVPGFLQAAADAYSNLQASAIDLYLAASSSSSWAETAADLWGDPTATWGVSGPTMRVVILDDPPMKSDFSGVFQSGNLGASAALWVWNGSAWGFAKNLGPTDVAEYAILPLSPGTYGDIRDGSPDLTKCPSAETIAHEIGHALGFTEARSRASADLSVLESPTTLPTLWQGVSPLERDPVRTLRFGAYTQSLLWHEFSAPSSGLDDWVMQSAVVRHDPTQPDEHAVPHSMFQVPEINPQHLVFKASSGEYVDCVTKKTPTYFGQFSEVSYVSSGCSQSATLKYLLNDTLVVGTHVVTNHCSAYSMWEYQHDEALVLTEADLTAAGVPTPPTGKGVAVTVDLTLQIHPVYAPGEWDPDDNEVTMSVTFYPEDTTDARCATQKHIGLGPVTDGRYGRVLAATQTAITSDMWTASGAPYRPVKGKATVGNVRMQKWDEEGNLVTSQVLASPLSVGEERFGKSLAIHSRWLAVGAPGASSGDGRAYLYYRTGDVWGLHTQLMPAGGSGQGGRFGTAVALYDFGDTTLLFVGEPEWDNMGRVAEYTINGTDAPNRSARHSGPGRRNDDDRHPARGQAGAPIGISRVLPRAPARTIRILRPLRGRQPTPRARGKGRAAPWRVAWVSTRRYAPGALSPDRSDPDRSRGAHLEG